jgi:hypothetical protein
LLHDEPHTLGYPGRGKSFVRAGKKKVIDKSFVREEKLAGCWRMTDFLEQVLGKRIHPTPEVSLDKIMTYVSAEYGVNEEELREPSRNRVVCEARAVIG